MPRWTFFTLLLLYFYWKIQNKHVLLYLFMLWMQVFTYFIVLYFQNITWHISYLKLWLKLVDTHFRQQLKRLVTEFRYIVLAWRRFNHSWPVETVWHVRYAQNIFGCNRHRKNKFSIEKLYKYDLWSLLFSWLFMTGT